MASFNRYVDRQFGNRVPASCKIQKSQLELEIFFELGPWSFASLTICLLLNFFGVCFFFFAARYVGLPCLVDADCFTKCRKPALASLQVGGLSRLSYFYDA